MINFQLFKKLYQRLPVKYFFQKVEILIGIVILFLALLSTPLIIWKIGNDNKIIDIYCEEIGCVYDVVGKIWVSEGKYYDTKNDCKKHCILESKNRQDIYDKEYYDEYVPKVIKEMPEYKRTWYYKTEKFFGE